jgi:hypothetical protein
MLFLTIFYIASCQESKDRLITQKNLCYQQKFDKLRESQIYKHVFSQFKDTFQILISNKQLFGVPEYMDTKTDDAIFFNKDSTECILIILQKPVEAKNIFGNARVVYGSKLADHWTFKVGLEFSYPKDYFETFKDNNFENISATARYSIMTSGKPIEDGCNIDENFWFIKMKN